VQHIYAVGDIHGRLDLLLAAFGRIEAHAGTEAARIVCLGDYIDRGPESRGVVERLMAGPRRAGDRLDCLMGNHEDMLLHCAAGGGNTPLWLQNGGDATMASYQRAAGRRLTPPELPAAHLDWMRRLPLSLETERQVFVHAGLRPGLPIAEQSDHDKLWIREPFLEIDHDFGKHVVHGHTPSRRPELRPFRTNLDTGAFHTGVLSIGVFDADRLDRPVEILQVIA